MSMRTGKTTGLNEILMNCDNIEDFKADILDHLQSQRKRWISKIAEILESTGMSQADLARKCEVSRATVLKWVRGSLPQSREMFIRIGLAAGYDIDQMNSFLMRYGRCPELYSKSLEDSIYMFVLNSDEIEHSYAACKTVFERVERSINPGTEKKKQVNGNSTMDTVLFTGYVLDISAIDELKDFINEHADVYRSAYSKFYDFVRAYVRDNNESYFENENADSIHYLAETLEWSSSLKKTVYAIYHNEWFPRRDKIISLGIHLNMNLDEINEMLSLAKMEKLYVMNPVEGIIMYALMDAELNDCIYQGTDELYQYVLKVFEDLNIDDPDLNLEELLV